MYQLRWNKYTATEKKSNKYIDPFQPLQWMISTNFLSFQVLWQIILTFEKRSYPDEKAQIVASREDFNCFTSMKNIWKKNNKKVTCKIL